MISATTISLNEENRIGNAIKSLKGVVDEIIVLDSGSSDKTIEIAKKLGAKVYFRKFDTFANQKNWALSKVRGEWILSLDADEEVSPSLTEEIKEAVKSDRYVGYLIPRRNFILGKEIKYSRWNPDAHIWLWKRNLGRWLGDVHEEVVVRGRIGLLKNSKIHHSHKTVASFLHANNLYSTLEAQSLFDIGTRFSFWKMWWDAIFESFLRFFYKLGFLDGKQGFVLAYLMGIYKLTVWIKVWELEQRK